MGTRYSLASIGKVGAVQTVRSAESKTNRQRYDGVSDPARGYQNVPKPEPLLSTQISGGFNVNVLRTCIL